MKNLEIKLHNEINDGLLSLWTKLWNESEYSHVFNSPFWLLACIKAFNISRFRIYACYYNKELVAVLPVVEEQKFGIKAYVSPGKLYIDKSTLLLKVNDIKVLEKLLNKIIEDGNVYLTEVPEEIVERISNIKTKGLLTLSSINPYINLEDGPFKHLSNKRRNKISNKIKKNSGNLSYGHYRTNLAEHLETVFKIEEESSKKIESKDSFSDPQIKKLFQSLIKYAKDYVVIDILYFKSTPFVSYFGFLHHNKFLAYHTAYKNDFAKLSPGKMIVFNLLSRLSKDDVSLFDFSRGHNIFKDEFTKELKFQYDFYYSKKPLIRLWWKGINSLRRFKQVIIRNERSLDDNYLFTKFKPKYINQTGRKPIPN